MQNSKNLSFYLEHKHKTGLRFRVRIKFDWVEFTSQCQNIHNVGGDNFVYKKKCYLCSDYAPIVILSLLLVFLNF